MLNKHSFHPFSSVAPTLRTITTGGGGGDSRGKSDFSGADNNECRSPSSQHEEFPVCISTSPQHHRSCTPVPTCGQEGPRRVLLARQGPANGEGVAASPPLLPGSICIDPSSAEREPSFKVYSGVNFYSSPHGSILRKNIKANFVKANRSI